MLRQTVIENEIKGLELDVRRAQNALARYKMVQECHMQNNFGMYFDFTDGILQERLGLLAEVEQHDEEQARDYQNRYHKFDANYFQALVSMSRTKD